MHSLVDYGDKENGLTAMMRTTGWPASIVAHMAADGRARIKPGAYPVEIGVPAESFVDEARKRGFNLTWKFRWLDRPEPAVNPKLVVL